MEATGEAMTIQPMLSEGRRKQKHKAAWAQVTKPNQREDLRPNCSYCDHTIYEWVVNGRTEELTRTGTIYSCNSCLWLAINSLRWD